MEEIALLIQTYDLATGPESRIYGKDTLLSDRRGKKKLAEILAEYPDGLDVRLLLCFLNDFI